MISLDVKCEKCDKAVDVCDLCEEPECKHVVCHDCLSVALDERKHQPHRHGAYLSTRSANTSSVESTGPKNSSIHPGRSAARMAAASIRSQPRASTQPGP